MSGKIQVYENPTAEFSNATRFEFPAQARSVATLTLE